MGVAANDNPLWRFSLAHYNKPEVANSCLRLQDNYGLDINLLLYGLWLATRQKALDMQEVEKHQPLRQCREEVLLPLRSARYAMRRIGMRTGRPRLYSQLKAVELEVESIEQKLLFRMTPAMPGSAMARRPLAQHNLLHYWRSLRPDDEAPPEEIQQLPILVLGEGDEQVFFSGGEV